jgi:hypothetical protein
VAAEGMLGCGTDVTNTFGDAPPPKQGLLVFPDKVFHDWQTINKRRPQILLGHVILVLTVMQGHPEALQLWLKYASKIIKMLKLKPTVHEPCLYLGLVCGVCVLLKRQVGNFTVATVVPEIVSIALNKIDKYLAFLLERMVLVTLLGGPDQYLGLFRRNKLYVSIFGVKKSHKFLSRTDVAVPKVSKFQQ